MRPLLIPQRFKVEPSDFAIPLTTIDTLPQRTALHPPHVVKVEPTVIDLMISDSESDAQPVTMTRKRARSSNSLSPSPSTPSSSPRSSTDDAYDTDDHLPAWPSAFYVVDIVRGFEKCEAADRSRKSVKEAFTKCFCIPFRHSTFYVHRRHWKVASQACRNEALCAGCTPAGTWMAFLERTCGKLVQEKKKKNTKRVKA